MELELVVPVPPVDFNFDSACSSPYLSAPSSPRRFVNFFFSAPTSPSGAATFYRDLNELGFAHGREVPSGSPSVVPFEWEEKPGLPKFKEGGGNVGGGGDEDFEFNFSGQLDRHSLSADELFDGGKIKPLKPPPRLQTNDLTFPSPLSSPRSPRSKISQGKKLVQEALSPKQRKYFDPFEEAMKETRKNGGQEEQTRGRDKNPKPEPKPNPSKFIHKGSRSLSPLRVSQIVLDEEDNSSSQKRSPSSSFLSSFSFSKGNRKWRLKDFLLFRSASEGRAAEKDNLRKYTAMSKKSSMEEVKNSSFRSTDSGGSVSSSRRSRGQVSAHEIHYTAKRAVAEEMKKKTFLPYKQGLLGCLGFNPSMNQISTSVGSLTSV